MFRSPHAKFGFVYSIVLCYIIALWYWYLKKKEKTLTSVLVLFFAIYGVIFFVYPSLLGSYIPKMQKVKNIPNEYSAVRDFLQLQTSADLWMLLPFNESTWDSNTWWYEWYHILHWMNTWVSFWNRNGLSFNSKNKIWHEAWYMLSDLNSKGFQLLRNQWYDIIVYDQSSSRDERFWIDENHISNIGWLLSQQQYISKIYSTGSLTVFSIK